MLLRNILFCMLYTCLFLPHAQGTVAWQGPTTAYIGFPGVSTERYAFLGKYSTSFEARETGEVMSSTALDIVNPLYTYVVRFPEIIPFENCSLLQRCWNGFWRKRVWARQTGMQFSPNSSLGCSIASYGVDRTKVSMGSASDLAAVEGLLSRVCGAMSYLLPQDRPHYVWLAYSRGVMAVLRYFSICPEPYRPQALILEGGIDEIPHFLGHLFDTHVPEWFKARQKPAWLMKTLLWGFKYFYAPGCSEVLSHSMKAALQAIPDNVPVLLVASLGDELVSYRCMVRMYDTLRRIRRDRGASDDNVHLLVLQHARHSYYVNGASNALARNLYQTCVHAFYKKYGLAYDAKLAEQGRDIFSRTHHDQASVHELLSVQSQPPCSVCATHRA